MSSSENLAIQRRPRLVLSCLECRRKKLKCDRLLPCQQCQKSGRSTLCSYSPGAEFESHSNGSEDGARNAKRVKKTPIPEQSSSQLPELDQPFAGSRHSGVLEELQDRVLRLEKAAGFPDRQFLNADDHHSNSVMASAPILPSRYNARQRKTLLSQFEDARDFLHRFEKRASNLDMALMVKDMCSLYGTVNHSKPEHHLYSMNMDTMYQLMSDMIPSQAICEKLISLYFDNHENCLRILHKPSFLAEHRTFWDSWRQSGNATSTIFVPTLLMVLSVASSLDVIPECKEVDVHGQKTIPSAFQLAHLWFESLPFKQRHTLAALQLKMLMLLPQRSRTARVQELWNMTGQVVRHAMAMGLHQEAPINMSVFETQLRRRLWITAVEEDLTMSLMCGMPPMVSSNDISSKVPENVNDLELFEDMLEPPTSRPTSEWTDSLCQHMLAGTLGQRLEAYHYVSNASSNIRYEVVLKYTRQLEKILQELPAPLRFNYVGDEASSKPGRLFARMALDIFIRRLLLNLYTPFAVALSLGDTFKEARVSYVQSCLVLLCYQDLFDPKFSELDVSRQEGYWDAYYKLYHHDVVQTCLGLCLEVKRLTSLSNSSYAIRPNVATSITSGDDRNGCSEKVQPWTKASIIKAVNDTIEPMVRRITRPDSNLRNLMYLVIVLRSVKTSQPSEQKATMIKEGVSELLLACQLQLQRDGISLPSPASLNDGRLEDLLDTPYDFASLDQFDLNLPTFPDMAYKGLGEQIEPAIWSYT